jgi:hypothetical protein
MENETTTASTAAPTLRAAQVYALAAICLVAGLGGGYLLRGSRPAASPAQPAAGAVPASIGAIAGGPMPGSQAARQMPAMPPHASGAAAAPHAGAMGGGRMPTMADMKQMADKQAAPLLDKLKSDPNNSDLLMKAGAIYYTTHQFKQASVYYGKAVQVEPKNVPFRVKLATSLFSSGDPDGAIAQLNQALSYDPKDANTLFDLGMIKLQGKQDGKGAVAAWQQLLKLNPQLSADRKATVQKLMADVLTTLGDQHGVEGAHGNDGH